MYVARPLLLKNSKNVLKYTSSLPIPYRRCNAPEDHIRHIFLGTNIPLSAAATKKGREFFHGKTSIYCASVKTSVIRATTCH